VDKGIWVPTNAMQVLDRLGLAGAVQQAGWPLERIQVRTTTGSVLFDLDLQRMAARYDHTIISIHRAALLQTLAEALPPDTLHLGKHCTGWAQDADKVTVRFEDGTQAEGKVLVGADGIRSIVREQLFPGIPLRYSGQTCYRGITDLDLPADLAQTCWEVWGGAARIDFSAVGPRQVYWFAPITAPAGEPEPGGSLAERLAALYATFPDPIPEILRRTPAADVIRTDLYDFAPIHPGLVKRPGGSARWPTFAAAGCRACGTSCCGTCPAG
jgi:2-polyprenyl-6-methoxyphenol hydroxylase-like FAD-dependent oxidoreductase